MVNRLLTIIGPTAVGKTKVAINIAKEISGEIISADSRQIYKYLDIGTAKPTIQERRQVNFHLIDFVDPNDNYSCGQFSRDAETKIAEIEQRKNIPIVCGGTGLYIKSLFNPPHELPQSDKKIKAKLGQTLQKQGLNYLYQRLLVIDPGWAKKIKSNDKQRILRGLEVYEMTGTPLSEAISKKPRQAKYLPNYVGLNLPRVELYDRIDTRFDAMIKSGLVEEVKSLLRQNFAPDSNALRTIGYKEIVDYLKGEMTLVEAIAKAKQRTRNFAKRQLTWFKKIPDVHWFNPEDPKIIKNILGQI